MANPWLTKNPLMSMWLSAENRCSGSVRGQTVAQAKRQAGAGIAEANPPPVPQQKARAKVNPTHHR